MSSFTLPLIATPINANQWKILGPFEYYTNTHGVLKGDIIRVPIGFITDFASIPQIFWSVIGGPTGKYTKAAVIHDWCYFKNLYTRKKCDQIFLEAMKVLKVSWWKRHLMYIAVRICAGIPWRRYRKKDIS